MGETSSRKIKLAKYLARDEKNPEINPAMPELREAMEIIDQLCIEETGKTTKELTPEEQDQFYTWCEKCTPLKVVKPAESEVA